MTERLRIITAKDPVSEAWGVVALRDGIEIDRWSPEEAIAIAADLDRKAKLCFRQGELPT